MLRGGLTLGVLSVARVGYGPYGHGLAGAGVYIGRGLGRAGAEDTLGAI